MKTMERGSLLRVPLVATMLGNEQVPLVKRGIDLTWSYQGEVPVSLAGFNPFTGAVYYAARSRLAEWLAEPERGVRPLNEGDRLVREVMFAVHDYLHAWAYLVIADLAPELGLGSAEIGAASLERFAFCHLLSEAAATVGLDYWYLATVEFDELVDSGSELLCLTTHYHERHRAEYQRFNPALEVQAPAFLTVMTDFYCSGVLRGFDAGDLRQSPRLAAWLEHELRYGVRQRDYIRRWLAYLASDDLRPPERPWAGPVATGAGWQRALCRDLGQALWDLVKNGRPYRFRGPARPPAPLWSAPPHRPVDGRFVNLNALGEDELERRGEVQDPESARYLVYQFLSTLDRQRCDPRLAAAIAYLKERPVLAVARAVLGGQPRLAAGPREPRDLMLLT
jgi:hypothetical protein